MAALPRLRSYERPLLCNLFVTYLFALKLCCREEALTMEFFNFGIFTVILFILQICNALDANHDQLRNAVKFAFHASRIVHHLISHIFFRTYNHRIFTTTTADMCFTEQSTSQSGRINSGILENGGKSFHPLLGAHFQEEISP